MEWRTSVVRGNWESFFFLCSQNEGRRGQWSRIVGTWKGREILEPVLAHKKLDVISWWTHYVKRWKRFEMSEGQSLETVSSEKKILRKFKEKNVKENLFTALTNLLGLVDPSSVLLS